MRLWITRAQPGAALTAAKVEPLGHDALVAPLLTLAPLPVDIGRIGGAAALAFTSRAGVEAFAAVTPDRSLPVYAVGEATAAAARRAGWARVESADGDGAALARLIARAQPAGGDVLAPGAREPAFDLAAALAATGIPARMLPVYAATPATAPPAAAADALAAGTLEGVLLHSPAAACALAALADGDAAFATALRPLKAFALSPACAAPIAPWLSHPPASASAPREPDLLALLPPPHVRGAPPLGARPRLG